MHNMCHNKPALGFLSFAGSGEAAEEALEKLSFRHSCTTCRGKRGREVRTRGVKGRERMGESSYNYVAKNQE